MCGFPPTFILFSYWICFLTFVNAYNFLMFPNVANLKMLLLYTSPINNLT